MLNKVMIIGRLGRDPELRYTQSGSPICNLNIATDESYTDRDGNKVDRAEWHRVVVFQRAAENCAQYLGKGSLGEQGGYAGPKRAPAGQSGGRPQPQRQQPRQDDYEDLGPAFPSEASGMDDVPF